MSSHPHSARTVLLASVFSALCLYQSTALLDDAGIMNARLTPDSLRLERPLLLQGGGKSSGPSAAVELKRAAASRSEEKKETRNICPALREFVRVNCAPGAATTSSSEESAQ